MGLCPDCLLDAGIGTRPSGTAGGGPAQAQPPPSPEELAPYFPQLEISSAWTGRDGGGVQGAAEIAGPVGGAETPRPGEGAGCAVCRTFFARGPGAGGAESSPYRHGP